jgi:hypothetical protein
VAAAAAKMEMQKLALLKEQLQLDTERASTAARKVLEPTFRQHVFY